MTTAQSALEANANANANNYEAAPPPRRLLTAEQDALLQSFREKYDIDAEDIYFGTRDQEPYFSFEALLKLSLILGDFEDIEVELGEIKPEIGLASARSIICLPTGHIRKMFGTCLIGEKLEDGSTVEDLQDAINVARARALRVGLKSVGFDVMKAHAQRLKGTDITFEPADTKAADIAQIHILAKEIGLVDSDGNDAQYRKLIGVFFPACDSSLQLTAEERSQFLSTLRSLRNTSVLLDRRPTRAVDPSTAASAGSRPTGREGTRTFPEGRRYERIPSNDPAGR